MQPAQLADILKGIAMDRKHLALEVGLSDSCMKSFLRSGTSPHRATVEKVEDYLSKKGLLKRAPLPVPTEVLEEDNALRNIGIVPFSESQKLTEDEGRRLICALYPDDEDLLDKILNFM